MVCGVLLRPGFEECLRSMRCKVLSNPAIVIGRSVACHQAHGLNTLSCLLGYWIEYLTLASNVCLLVEDIEIYGSPLALVWFDFINRIQKRRRFSIRPHCFSVYTQKSTVFGICEPISTNLCLNWCTSVVKLNLKNMF